MLPSKGYFGSLNCPFYDSGECDRPHCHFRHVRRDKSEKTNETPVAADSTSSDCSAQPDALLKHLVTEAVKQVLSHTEVREKAEGSLDTNAIVSDVCNKLQPSIGTVPCEANSVGENNGAVKTTPSYKPTPIAELKKRHIPVMYAPEKPTGTIRKDKKSSINTKEKLKYVPQVPDGANKLIATYKPTPPDKILKASEYAPDGEMGNLASYIPSKISGSLKTNTSKNLDKPEMTILVCTDPGLGDMANMGENNFQESKIKLGDVEHVLGCEFNGSSYYPLYHKKSDTTLKQESAVVNDIKIEKKTSSGYFKELVETTVSDVSLVKKSNSDTDEQSTNNAGPKLPLDPGLDVKLEMELKLSDPGSSENFDICEDLPLNKNVIDDEAQKKKSLRSSSHSKTSSKRHKSDRHSGSKSKSNSHSRRSSYKDKHSDYKSSHRDKKEKYNSKKEERHKSKHRYDKRKSDHRSSSHSHKSKSSDKSHSHSDSKKTAHATSNQPLEVSKRRLSSDESINSDIIEVVQCGEPIVIVSSPENWDTDSESEDPNKPVVLDYVAPPTKKRISHFSGEGKGEGDSLISFKQTEAINLTKTLCDRWQKARQSINKNPSQGKIKISSVPNVSSLLTARDRIMKATTTPVKPRNLQEEIDNPSPKVVQRVARVPSIATSARPIVEADDDCKVPVKTRQTYLNSMFDEYSKYLNPELASEKALNQEKEISQRIKSIQTYQSAMAVAVMRIRKTKGDDKKKAIKIEFLTSASIPDFTYGYTLYECFSRYILTQEELKYHGYPMEVPDKPGYYSVDRDGRWSKVIQPDHPYKRICVNCSEEYYVDDDGIPVTKNDCNFHWGKGYKTKVQGAWITKYSCCGGEMGAEPCSSGRYHVCEMLNYKCLDGFVVTQPLPDNQSDVRAGVYALDCEMCYTVRGMEVTRCTLVDLNGETIFNKMILPDYPILDYCTRFSGVTEESLRGVTDRLEDIQQDLLGIINSRSILVGHSLENDLKVLRLFHDRVVDTSCVFPHKMGPPRKRALRHLTEEFLNLKIQDSESGHDSAEDAKACMSLMLWKIKQDAKLRKPRVILSLV